MKKILVSPSSFGECGSEPIDLLQKAGYEIVINPYGRKLTELEILVMVIIIISYIKCKHIKI